MNTIRTQAIPDLATPAAEICDPKLLLARTGYRTYQYFHAATTRPPSLAQHEMMADLDRLTELLDTDRRWPSLRLAVDAETALGPAADDRWSYTS
jgi:hypothetical protein